LSFGGKGFIRDKDGEAIDADDYEDDDDEDLKGDNDYDSNNNIPDGLLKPIIIIIVFIFQYRNEYL